MAAAPDPIAMLSTRGATDTGSARAVILEIQDAFRKGDSARIAAHGVADVAMVQRATGRVIQCKIASFHRVRGGKVIEYRGFTDSFDAVEQVLGRELPL
jgi:ketosteroid isomerase-like protein